MATGNEFYNSFSGSPFSGIDFGTGANLKLSGIKSLDAAKGTSGASGMAFPFMAAATLGSSVLGGIFGGRQEAANRQLAADLGKMQAEAAMQAAFRGAQTNQWGQVSLPEYEYQRQKRAREYENLFFAPQERMIRSEDTLQAFRDELSPEGRELSARRRAGALAESAAERRAITDAMFGAPVFNASRYSNPAWMQSA
jgi:hypothetical protein